MAIVAAAPSVVCSVVTIVGVETVGPSEPSTRIVRAARECVAPEPSSREEHAIKSWEDVGL